VPANVTVSSRSSEEWSRFDHEPVGDTLGEASIYSMLLHNGIIDVGNRFGYSHPVSDGWAGDKLVPYRSDDEFGYVWQTEWDTRTDAEEFHDAYLDLLAEHGAQEHDGGEFVVPDGSFEDAFRVTLDGTTVTVVNGPTVSSLSEIHGR